MIHRVFVYGTLKRGFPNAAPLNDQTYLGHHRTTIAFPLVVAGRWFSPVLVDEPGTGHPVEGELYEVDDTTLATLDRIEGVGSSWGYDRVTIEIEPLGEGTPTTAEAYLKRRERLDLVHDGPLARYEPDERYVPPDRRGG